MLTSDSPASRVNSTHLISASRMFCGSNTSVGEEAASHEELRRRVDASPQEMTGRHGMDGTAHSVGLLVLHVGTRTPRFGQGYKKTKRLFLPARKARRRGNLASMTLELLVSLSYKKCAKCSGFTAATLLVKYATLSEFSRREEDDDGARRAMPRSRGVAAVHRVDLE